MVIRYLIKLFLLFTIISEKTSVIHGVFNMFLRLGHIPDGQRPETNGQTDETTKK